MNCRRVSQPRWVGARRSTKGGKGDRQKGKPAAFVLPCAQVGCACSRGLPASASERERALRAGPFSRAANLPYESRGPSFYRCKERVQVYNGEHSNVLTCLSERSQSLKYMPSWLSKRFWRPVHVMLWPSEERLSPRGSTAVGVVGSLLTSPCFRKGLRAAVVMEHAGRHHYLFTGASQTGRRSCSP